MAYTKTDLFETQRKREKDALERLQLPEASWSLPELQASGKKFTYEFNGRTEEKSLDNSFLVGYGALRNAFISLTSL